MVPVLVARGYIWRRRCCNITRKTLGPGKLLIGWGPSQLGQREFLRAAIAQHGSPTLGADIIIRGNGRQDYQSPTPIKANHHT